MVNIFDLASVRDVVDRSLERSAIESMKRIQSTLEKAQITNALVEELSKQWEIAVGIPGLQMPPNLASAINELRRSLRE